MPFLSLRDIDLYYEQAGSGSNCLLISGTGGDLRFKPNLLDSPLSAHFRVARTVRPTPCMSCRRRKMSAFAAC